MGPKELHQLEEIEKKLMRRRRLLLIVLILLILVFIITCLAVFSDVFWADWPRVG